MPLERITDRYLIKLSGEKKLCFMHNTAYKPIENYGVIGNLHTIALVSLTGSIDYLPFIRAATELSKGEHLRKKVYLLIMHQK